MRKILPLVALFAFGLQSAEAMAPGAVTRYDDLLLPISQTVDPCHKQCAPLLSLDSKSESKRTYHNCRVLCAGEGEVICPDGSRKSLRNGIAPKC